MAMEGDRAIIREPNATEREMTLDKLQRDDRPPLAKLPKVLPTFERGDAGAVYRRGDAVEILRDNAWHRGRVKSIAGQRAYKVAYPRLRRLG